MMSKKLVAYFSAGGVTAAAAKSLAEAVGADIYEIRPATPYTKADLDWTDRDSRSRREMRDRTFRPPLADQRANIGAYDVVFLGFPIWCYVAPTLIHTFLEAYDFSCKTIVPFATSGGSSLGRTAAALRDSVSGNATVLEGRVLNGRLDRAELATWAERLGV